MQHLPSDIGSPGWQVVTHLGSSSLLLPIVALVSLGLWRTGQVAALRIWLPGLAAAVTLTLATKIAYMGWGMAYEPLDFTGISGHTVLVSSVLPLLLGWLLAKDPARPSRAGIALGLLIAAAVGISRLVLQAHSPSEVAVAWLLGSLITWAAVRAVSRASRPPWFVSAAPLILLMAFSTPASTYLPSHQLEVRLALLLSGRERPYHRSLAPPQTPQSATRPESRRPAAAGPETLNLFPSRAG